MEPEVKEHRASFVSWQRGPAAAAVPATAAAFPKGSGVWLRATAGRAGRAGCHHGTRCIPGRASPGRGVWEGASAQGGVSLGQGETCPLAPWDTPACGGNGSLPSRAGMGGFVAAGWGWERGKSWLWSCWVSLHRSWCRWEVGGEAAGADAWGFGTSNRSPGLNVQAARGGKRT